MSHPDPEVEVDGEMWFTFSIDFDVELKKYGFYIYARSFEHAEEMLAAIKASARVSGQTVEFIDAGDMDLDDVKALMAPDRVLN